MSNILLRIENVIKEYRTGKAPFLALKGVTLDIYEGEVLGLLGVNGAGKTTLSSIIATLIPATGGTVLFNNKSLYDQDNMMAFRRVLGFCPQKLNVNPAKEVDEALTLTGRIFGFSEEEIVARKEKLIKQFGLEPHRKKAISELSGGYQQRFSLARALMNNPKLVILDEPTVALDPHIRREIWSLVRELKALGVTVLLTTHYLDEAEALADRVCVLDKGRIQLIDTPENLKTQFSKKNLEDVFLQLIDAASEDTK